MEKKKILSVTNISTNSTANQLEGTLVWLSEYCLSLVKANCRCNCLVFTTWKERVINWGCCYHIVLLLLGQDLTYAGLDVDPLPGEEMLEVLHPQLHQFPPVRRFLVENSTSRASSSLGWKTGATEDIGAVSAGPLPADEAEGFPTEVTVHCWGLAGLAGFIGGATTHGATGAARLKIFQNYNPRQDKARLDDLRYLKGRTIARSVNV